MPGPLKNAVMTVRETAGSRRTTLALLIAAQIVTCCVSLYYAAHYSKFFIFYDSSHLASAVAAVAAYSVVSLVFVFARFSFGYFVAFYFYTMVLGFLWLNCFSRFDYDHRIAALSAALSGIAFFIPALFVSSPMPPKFTLSAHAFQRVLQLILISAVVTVAISSLYNLRLVSPIEIYEYRQGIKFPVIINYLTGTLTTSLLPFAFACFWLTRKYWSAAIALLLLLSFYPVTLTKLTLFAPFWLLALALLSSVIGLRVIVILTLLLPTLAGIVLIVLLGEDARAYFDIVNLRMTTIPSSALDVYNDFFSKNAHTYFCQIRVLKFIVDCPYSEQLSLVMREAYATGNFNASLFATEGIASVGPVAAPLVVAVCGLVIAMGNRISASLPPRLVLISSAILPQLFLNVPFTVILVTNGLWLLLLLWYVTPRAIFEAPDEIRA